MSTTEPETAAAEPTPAVSPDLSGAAEAATTASVPAEAGGADMRAEAGSAAPESQLPGPAVTPEPTARSMSRLGSQLDKLPGPAPEEGPGSAAPDEGSPAADEAAAGPGSQQEPPARMSLREIDAHMDARWAQISPSRQPVADEPSWPALFGAYDVAARQAHDAGEQEWNAVTWQWSVRVRSEMTRASIRTGIAIQDADRTAAA